MISASEFIHPDDETALEQLESIPGLEAVVKKVLEVPDWSYCKNCGTKL